MECNILSNEEWDQQIENCNRTTIFHSRTWNLIWENVYPGSKAICYRFIFEDGLEMYLPGLRRKMFRNRIVRFDSGVMGTYGGLISKSNIPPKYIDQVFEYLKRNTSFYLTQYDVNSESDVSFLTPVDDTYIVNISHFSTDKQCYSASAVTHIQKAKKNGLVVKEAITPEEWRLYYGLYLESGQRWNKSTDSLYPIKLFDHIQGLPSDQFRLFVVYDQDQMVYGCLVFLYKNTAYYWHGAGSQNGLKLGAAYLIHDFIIRFLQERGFTHYDLMPNGGNEGLKEFKSRFKPVVHTVFGCMHKTPLYQVMEKLSQWNQMFRIL